MMLSKGKGKVKVMEIDEILLRRKSKILLSKASTNNVDYDIKQRYVLTMNKNIESIGYTLSHEVMNRLVNYSKTSIVNIYSDVVNILNELVGNDVEYKPMYPNFPSQVMEASDVELYVNAILHYLSDGLLLPYEEKKLRFPLIDNVDLKVIDLAEPTDIVDIFNNLCKSKTSLSETDKKDVETLYKAYSDLLQIPDEIPLKENVALLIDIYLKYNDNIKFDDIKSHFKTATDILRFVTQISDGDISLASNTKYRNLKRKERRLIMDLLNNIHNIEEDMNRYKNKWIRIGEIIHPGEFNKDKYKKVIDAFDKLRNNKKIETFYGKINDLLSKESYGEVVKLLSKRPGEFARNLDLLLRKSNDQSLVINEFKKVSDQVSTTVLLQVREHFINRKEHSDIRVFFPKGNIQKCFFIDNEVESIDEKYCNAIIKICEVSLVNHYNKKDFLGNVYLSEELKNYNIPFSQRSASKSLKTITRGSRIKISDDAKILRSFIWWTNCSYNGYESRVDIDLSAAMFDEDWNYMNHISYTKLRNSCNAVHSGDIVDGGNINGTGVSEFIDIDIDSFLKYGKARYVVFQVYSFTGQHFSDIPNAKFGWMEREDFESGEIYEPSTVTQKMDLFSNNTSVIPVIFDLQEREFIWCDMSSDIRNTFVPNNLESHLSIIGATCLSMTNMSKPNMYDLIKLHIAARGIEVDNKEDADIIFDVDDGITPFDLDVFMGEYL